MQSITRSFTVLALSLATAGTLAAQTTPTHTQVQAQAANQNNAPMPLRFGAQIGYNFDADLVGFGARLEHSLSKVLGSPRVDGLAEANWFPGTVDVFDLNYNVIYRFRAPTVTPYAGGGVAFLIASGGGNTNSDLHLNAVGGVEFKPMGILTPFVQLRYLFAGGGDALILSGGVFF
jgi:hypothetical protein